METRCAMAIEYTVIGRHIRAARKRKHLTQEDVADMIDMSPAHFGKVERGERPVNLQRLSQISHVLDIPLEKLVEGASVADDGCAVRFEADGDDTDFLESIESISKGCSPQALRLMLRLCAAVAEENKAPR